MQWYSFAMTWHLLSWVSVQRLCVQKNGCRQLSLCKRGVPITAAKLESLVLVSMFIKKRFHISSKYQQEPVGTSYCIFYSLTLKLCIEKECSYILIHVSTALEKSVVCWFSLPTVKMYLQINSVKWRLNDFKIKDDEGLPFSESS